MNIEDLAIPDVKRVTPERRSDERGFFFESYNARDFAAVGLGCDFVQDNHSYSARKWTIRGLHFQAAPHAQAKLVRVLRGVVLDVAVDVRKGSPTFGDWVKTELSAETGAQIYVPAGFLHGFLTLAPDTEVAYKVDAFYAPDFDGAVFWNDPALAIDWGIGEGDAAISDKDARAMSWADYQRRF